MNRVLAVHLLTVYAGMRPARRKGMMMTKKQTVLVCVVDQEKYDPGPFNFGGHSAGTLNAVINSLIAIRKTIPAEFRETASCEIDSDGGYEGSHYARIKVEYERPETAEEAKARIAHAEQVKKNREATERSLYAELRSKYG